MPLGLAGKLLIKTADQYRGARHIVYTPVTNAQPVTAYLTPDGNLLGRSSEGGPSQFQAALNRAMNMRFNVSQTGNTNPLAMGWTAPTLSTSYGYGLSGSFSSSANSGSSMIPVSMLRSGYSSGYNMSYGLGYGSAYGVGYGSGSYGYSTTPDSYSWQPNPSTTPWTPRVPSYYLQSPYASKPTWTGGPGNNFDNVTTGNPPNLTDPGRITPTNPPGDTDDSDPIGEYAYREVGRIDRAPMAMFEHNGELLISAVTRSGINETPIWSYSESTGVQKKGQLAGAFRKRSLRFQLWGWVPPYPRILGRPQGLCGLFP